MRNSKCRMIIAGLMVAGLAGAAGSATAATLGAGEYACAGSGGTILIGLGFKLRADGTYTDLDGKSSGRVVYQGNGVRFVGGHLGGEVGRNVRSNGLEIHSISCSRG